MHSVIKSVATTYSTPEAAQVVAANLQAGDEDWKYVVEQLPNGRARIRIEDEAGEFVCYFGS
jgi:hypothetical protein